MQTLKTDFRAPEKCDNLSAEGIFWPNKYLVRKITKTRSFFKSQDTTAVRSCHTLKKDVDWLSNVETAIKSIETTTALKRTTSSALTVEENTSQTQRIVRRMWSP